MALLISTMPPQSEVCWTTGEIFLRPSTPAALSRLISRPWASGCKRPAPKSSASRLSASSCPRLWLECSRSVLLYHLVRRHFGVVAGLLAALALAISPISVLTNRNNTIDSTLVLVMLLGAWAVLKAAEKGKLRWLLLCAVFVGLGFNIKMLEAYLCRSRRLARFTRQPRPAASGYASPTWPWQHYSCSPSRSPGQLR